MAASKPKGKDDKASKVFDVAKPGKTAASASSRPLIVGHKPILKDPMVKEESVSELDEAKTLKIDSPVEEDIPSGSPPLPSAEEVASMPPEKTEVLSPSETKLTIQPLSSKAASKSKATKDTSSDDKIVVKTGGAATTAPVVAKSAAKKGVSASDDKEEKAEEPAEPETDTSEAEQDVPVDEQEKPAEDTDESAEPESKEEDATDSTESETADSEASDSISDIKEDSGELTEEEKKRADKQAQEAAAAAAKDEAAEKMAASQQYFVPIGEKTRKKRSLRRILTGAFLIILLGGALTYLMMDVGIIKTNMDLPYHFFKQTALSDSTANTSPATTSEETTVTKKVVTTDPYSGWKTATLKNEKISYKYPSDWKLEGKSSTKEEANASLATVGCSISSGQDIFSLTAPNGDIVSLYAGQTCRSGVGYATYTDFTPIKTLGTDKYIAFQVNPSNSKEVTSAVIYNQAKNGPSGENSYFPASKSITGASAPYNLFDFSLKDDASESLANFKANSNFVKAKLIFESLKY